MNFPDYKMSRKINRKGAEIKKIQTRMQQKKEYVDKGSL
jgi:hypothetical protein